MSAYLDARTQKVEPRDHTIFQVTLESQAPRSQHAERFIVLDSLVNVRDNYGVTRNQSLSPRSLSLSKLWISFQSLDEAHLTRKVVPLRQTLIETTFIISLKPKQMVLQY